MSVTAELQFTRVGTNSVVEESLLFFLFLCKEPHSNPCTVKGAHICKLENIEKSGS